MVGIGVKARSRGAIALSAILCSAALPFAGHAAVGGRGDLHRVASSQSTRATRAGARRFSTAGCAPKHATRPRRHDRAMRA